MADSSVASGVYTISLPAAAAPKFSPIAGSYTGTQNVAITSSTSGASIAYTTDGSTPTAVGGVVTHGTLYVSPVAISSTTTLEAVAFKTGDNPSSVTSGVYTIAVVAPVFGPAASTYASGSTQSVFIGTATNGATIRYTTNGTAPTSTSGTIYSGPVSISATTTLEAIAYETGLVNSTVTSGVYTFAPAAATPVFSPAAGIYSSAQTVTITSTTSGATIRYTIDGSTPTETNGTAYAGPVSISTATVLKAIAYKSGLADSPVASGIYMIGTPASVLNVLYDFPSLPSNIGGYPSAGLVRGSDGNFYGVTSSGGSANAGAVFKMTPAGIVTALVSFNVANGANPEAALVQGSDGNFYGVTSSGGSANDGTVFMMTPAGVLTAP